MSNSTNSSANSIFILYANSKGSKTFMKWLKRIEDVNTPWTENDIIYFRKAIGSSGLKCSTERSNLRKYFKETVRASNGFSITSEQSSKGINYIRNKALRKNGDLRQAKDNCFSRWEADIMLDFKEFRLIGIINASRNYYDFYLPVYRCIANNGDSFEYTTNRGLMEVL